MMFTRFIEQRPSVSAFVAGALLALCFAPFHVVPLLFVIIPLFFSLLYHAPSAGVAIRHAFLFGYGFFIAGTYWIAFSLLVDASMHGWLVPFSVLGLSAALALYFVPLGWLIYRMRHKPLWFVALMFMVSWVGLEWLRGQGVLGFPWNLVGYTVAPSVNVSQLAAYVGIHGVSVFVLLVSLLPWCVWKSVKHPILRLAAWKRRCCWW